VNGLDVDGQVVLLLVGAALALLLYGVSDEKVHEAYDVFVVLVKILVHEAVELHLLRNRKSFDVADAYGVAHKGKVIAEGANLGHGVIQRDVDKEVTWVVVVRLLLLHRVVALAAHHLALLENVVLLC